MPHRIHCVKAQDIRGLDDALAVRWRVFGDELGLLPRRAPFMAREPDGYDTLETTVHFVAYDGKVPVGTVRMLLPNEQVARANGWRLGLDLERRYDLGGLTYVSGLAELTRVCILRPWRRSWALASMVRAMYVESRQRGVMHWVGAAHCDTDCLGDARIAHRLLRRQGLLSEQWRVEPSAPAVAPASPRRPLYPLKGRASAKERELGSLWLPPLVAYYARTLGARYLGEPTYDAAFNLCLIPLVISLCDIPGETLAPAAARRAPRPPAAPALEGRA